ncbi:MAG: class I SAM-dependent methyltransferase [Verrucomicrobiota bacterium]|nr:class I SAM-dependent methyltransferase [Verrucomicrobiota bacterium]
MNGTTNPPGQTELEQHRCEIEKNRARWEEKELLRRIYDGFYGQIISQLPVGKGPFVELGSGMGNLKKYKEEVICTDLFPNRGMDLVCDGYSMPFAGESIGALLLFDVFHHLEKPAMFLAEAERCLRRGGRLIIFDPYISLFSRLAYAFHHEPMGMKERINLEPTGAKPGNYYAAQGNATRLFFASETNWLGNGWKIAERRVITSFAYLLSGGFSKSGLYPAGALGMIEKADRVLEKFPGVFGARCLIVLERR